MIMKNFNCNKKNVLADEYQDVDSERLIDMLSVVDDLRILFIVEDFHGVGELTSILRGDIFLLVKEKMEDE